VTWVPEIRLHTKCVMKVKDFPFDSQCCEINFYSWAHTATQMVIQQYGNKNVTNLTHLTYNTEWMVYDTCAINKTIITGHELEWWVTSYVIYIKRESIYHIYTLLMPCGSKYIYIYI
jgi:nicotinic acetylcholine receptor, invertebrate